MKPIIFCGQSLEMIRDFPLSAKREAGYQPDRVQRGLDPVDWKPMKSIGQGVREIRIHEDGQYRIIYIAKFEDAICVLHAFQRKSQKAPKADIDRAKQQLVAAKERPTS